MLENLRINVVRASVEFAFAEPRFVNNRGTAFLAFQELGVASLSDVDQLCRIAQTYHPKSENRALYDGLFEQFIAAWDQNRPIFEALNG